MGVAEVGWVEIGFLLLSAAESKGRQNEYLNEKLDFLCSVKKKSINNFGLFKVPNYIMGGHSGYWARATQLLTKIPHLTTSVKEHFTLKYHRVSRPKEQAN